MKHTYFLLLTICALNFSYGQVGFGIINGINLTKCSEIPGANGYRTGWNAGAFSQINLRHNLWLQPELFYTSKNYFDESEVYNLTLQLRYISLPVLLAYHPTKNFGISIGPELSYLSHAALKLAEGSQKYDVTSRYKRWDMGLDFGLA